MKKSISQCMDDSGMREKYDPARKKKPKQIINNAIREECPGGEQALENRTATAAIMNKHRDNPNSEQFKIAKKCYRFLNDIVFCMEENIRLKYKLPKMD